MYVCPWGKRWNFGRTDSGQNICSLRYQSWLGQTFQTSAKVLSFTCNLYTTYSNHAVRINYRGTSIWNQRTLYGTLGGRCWGDGAIMVQQHVRIGKLEWKHNKTQQIKSFDSVVRSDAVYVCARGAPLSTWRNHIWNLLQVLHRDAGLKAGLLILSLPFLLF